MKVDNYTSPKYYFNREVSWLKFNQRVLQEAVDKVNPLLERLRFLAIGSSNLDEFFMIRVAGLRHQEQSGIVKYDAAHMDASMQLKAINEAAKKQVALQYGYLGALLKDLSHEGIHILKMDHLTADELEWAREYFKKMIFPVITPLAVDSGHPFPFLVNKTTNTVVMLHKEDSKEERMAILPIPSVLSRLIEMPNRSKKEVSFLLLEDLVNYFSGEFFLGYHIDKQMTFRVTRDADLDIAEEEATDLLREIERSLRKRRRGAMVRLEVSAGYDEELLSYILDNLQLEREWVYEVKNMLDLTCLFQLCDIPGYDHLRFQPYYASYPRDLEPYHSIFEAIQAQDILVHHPFESFRGVENFIAEAAQDPNVLAIKQTLYRVSGDSPIITALVKAADRGKQVTVLMEVKARFDEENNILMARRLEKAGCHVIYGLKGLKTHSKITMVVRREEDIIRRYLHIATGNYNSKTARLYTDCGYFTCDECYSEDASMFFNLISGYSDPPEWHEFIVAPLNLRQRIMELIDGEIEEVKAGREGHIIAKMNSLLDRDVIAKLYEASAAGVKIELIIRGICTLRPGIEGVSDHITVRSIVGRFLEHHRILYFKHGGDDKIFISSADWMPRNLNDRVELMIPIENGEQKERLYNILRLYLSDNQKSHIMRADGSYRKSVSKENPIHAQQLLMDMSTRPKEREKVLNQLPFQPLYQVSQNEEK